jgi:hypothetical protein
LIIKKIRGDVILESLAKKIEQIINQFATEELGNRLSQFAVISFKETILNEIKSYKSIVNEANKEVKKEKEMM